MTQVIRVLPLWHDRTVVPKRKRLHPARGFSDARRGHGGKPRLTEDDVRAMRLAGDWGWPVSIVSMAFGTTHVYTSMVMRGESHSHVR